MSRAVYVTAFALLVVGGSTFLYKHLALEMPVQPDRAARVWRVEFDVSVRGESSKGRVELWIPSSDERQAILDEQSFDDGLEFRFEDAREGRRAVWRGPIEDSARLSYAFHVHLPRSTGGAPLPADRPDTVATANDPGIRPAPRAPLAFREVLDRFEMSEDEDPAAVIATIFGFVTDEIETAPSGTEDPRLTLRAREGSILGQSRLLVDLLHAAEIDARLARGISLPSSGRAVIVPFVEAWNGRSWTPLFPDADRPSDMPSRFVTVARGDRPLLATSGAQAAHFDVNVLRESLSPSELASVLSPESTFWRSVSLYRLPVETQVALKVLLVIPIAVLLAAVFRNLVGIRTFGTFMPVLIALSLRTTDLASGLILVSSVIGAGVVGRLLLDRLRLLFVPRICVLLCVVILFVAGLAQLGYQLEGRSMMSGLLFPIVILAMLIERISVTTLEEGLRSTLKLLGGSIALATLVYPVFQSAWLAHLFFGFPELVLCVMAFLILVGGYTGYRLSELWRFRAFASPAGASQ